jgi:hypothetical protein
MSTTYNQVCNSCRSIDAENNKLRRELRQKQSQLNNAENKILTMQQENNLLNKKLKECEAEIEHLKKQLEEANAKFEQHGGPAAKLAAEASDSDSTAIITNINTTEPERIQTRTTNKQRVGQSVTYQFSRYARKFTRKRSKSSIRYQKLDTFEASQVHVEDEVLVHPESMISIFNEVLEVDKRNEADYSNIIAQALATAVLLLQNGARLKSQYNLVYGQYKGKADWAIKCNGKVIMVAEAKSKNLDEGVAQNKLQMLAAHQENTNGKSEAGTIYGVVSTASKWLILRTEFAADGSYKVTQSDVSPISLPLGAESDAKKLHEQFKWLMENMMCPLYEQAGVLPSQKDAAAQPTQE